MSKQSTAGLVKYVKFLVEAGAMKPPVWLHALEKCAPAPPPDARRPCRRPSCLLTPPPPPARRVPPPPPATPGRRPPKIVFPEDEHVRHYYRRHPEAVLHPLNLGAYEPPVARRFAARQMELLAQGLPRREARDTAEREFKAAAAAAPAAASTVVEVVQAEEEAHLSQALATYTDRNGFTPPPVPAARPGWQGQPGGGRFAPRPLGQAQTRPQGD
jgi:hypothetical protein